MALSDQLANLSVRAKQFEDRAAAAKTEAKTDLEQDVKNARESAQEQASELRNRADSNKDRMSTGWEGIQRSWSDHQNALRKNIDDRKAAHDLKGAQKAADRAEADAAFAIDYAYAAMEEAEYAVLDATLARREADELASK
jgi:hypothetical protein